MRVCMIIDNPETTNHPIISAVLQKLRATHDVRLLDVRQVTAAEALAEEEQYPLADLYLLKSHAPQALEVAHALEQRGAVVVNSWTSSLLCQNRVQLSQKMEEAHLPWPSTIAFDSLAHLLEQRDLLATLSFPLIMKSRYSSRNDLVAKVDSVEELASYAPEWSQEPVVLQAFTESDGWDIKFWVIDQQVFAARRRTPLAGAGKEDYPIPAGELPTEWVRIVREVGRTFDLRLYGVDLLLSDSGPVIVDVNSFPGFRGVAGAADALVTLVERLLQEIATPTGTFSNQHPAGNNLSIEELPSLVHQLFTRVHLPLLPGTDAPVGLFVRYLRRKPERGLAVIYNVDEIRRKPSHHSGAPNRSVSLTLGEAALDGSRIRFQEAEAQQAEIKVQEPGILHVDALDLSVQAFPADSALPTLAASCDTTPQSQLFQALEQAAQLQLNEPAWHLVATSAEPVRYKPASRCVIRYHLTLERQWEGLTTPKALTIYGKVYSDVEQAQKIQAMMQALYEEQISSGQPFPLLPRPLGASDIAGLVFNEAVQPANPDEAENRVRTGNQVFRPQVEYRCGMVKQLILPEEELRLTGEVLARLHTSAVQPRGGKLRTGAQEAKRARERARLLASHNPQQASDVLRLAQELGTALEAAQPDAYLPAHGGFKSSQLLFHSHAAFVVDFDGFCLADPALDIGYFLAYLRPSMLWYHHLGMRQWFEASAQRFVDAYREAMRARGVNQQALDESITRSKLYEAALLFKIATRRVNRLNSPRPGELAAMLDEITLCLSR